MNGKIHNFNNNGSLQDQFESMRDFKENCSPKNYCQGNAKCLTPILEYAYALSFSEKPNYNYICFLFKKVLLDLDQVPSESFNWKEIATSVISVQSNQE